MKFMMFVKHNEDYRNHKPPQSLYDAMGEFVGREMKAGHILDTAGLNPTADGLRIKLKGGKLTTVDGPFTESKEIVGGYALVDVPTKEEAIAIATEFMELHRVHWPEFEGESEVRPLEDFDAPQ
jgi:hypothetical protein